MTADFSARRLAASASFEAAQAAMDWLREVLEEQVRLAADEQRAVEVMAQLDILKMHQVVATDEIERRVHLCWAKCTGESWRVYSDGENVVEAPCRHVRLLAQAYAFRDGFPEVLLVA